MNVSRLLLTAGSMAALGALSASAAVAGDRDTGSGAAIVANEVATPMILDGDITDWREVAPTRVPLSGVGGAAEVEIRAAIHAGRLYMLAIWADPTWNNLHKPHRWNEATFAYEKADEHEDRFAVSMPIAGEFSANKLSGSGFVADVWHWKAHRSNPLGLAHDKIWQVSPTPFEGSRAFPSADGSTVHLRRQSDAGDRLYKPKRYIMKHQDLMPGYELNEAAAGSVADVAAHGTWQDGQWVLELSRALDTGHEDDAVIPYDGEIPMAFAVFDGISYNTVDGGSHSTSAIVRLRTRPAEAS